VAVNEYEETQEKDKNGERYEAGYDQVLIARLCFVSHKSSDARRNNLIAVLGFSANN
jgi:hypothetical protein